MKTMMIVAIGLGCVLFARLSSAGELVFGPQRFTIQSGRHLSEAVTFQIANPSGTYWLQVSNGEAIPKPGAEPGTIEMINVVAGGRILLNGHAVAKPPDFHIRHTKSSGFSKDVILLPVNTLEIDVRGEVGSFITVQIRKAEPNVTVSNREEDLSGYNLGDAIHLVWEDDDRLFEYVVYRGLSSKGPWEEVDRTPARAPNTVDITPEARQRDLYYRVEAVDTSGKVVRRYDPVCVPKFVEPLQQSFTPHTTPAMPVDVIASVVPTSGQSAQADALRVCLAERHRALAKQVGATLAEPQRAPSSILLKVSMSLQALASDPPVNELCLDNGELTDPTLMNLHEIRTLLTQNNSFLKGQIPDVDGVMIDAGQEIFDAAQNSGINP